LAPLTLLLPPLPPLAVLVPALPPLAVSGGADEPHPDPSQAPPMRSKNNALGNLTELFMSRWNGRI
jgi:hypothetical protein